MSAPVMPLWVDSYLAATTDLTATEHGAYLLLLMTAWKNDGRLPNDDKKLARIARLTSGQWARVKDNVLSFWDVDGDVITQSRQTKELAAVKRKSASASNSARSRWLKTNGSGDANASDPQCYPKPYPKPVRERPNGLLSETSSDVPPPKAKKGKGAIKYPEAFERLWAAYPSRPNQSKAKALEAWLKFDAERRDGAVIAAPLFAQQCRQEGTDPQFIPHCSTWLNERRFDAFVDYEDEAPTDGESEDRHPGRTSPPARTESSLPSRDRPDCSGELARENRRVRTPPKTAHPGADLRENRSSSTAVRLDQLLGPLRHPGPVDLEVLPSGAGERHLEHCSAPNQAEHGDGYPGGRPPFRSQVVH